jgi:hypothetical protein
MVVIDNSIKHFHQSNSMQMVSIIEKKLTDVNILKRRTNP